WDIGGLAWLITLLDIRNNLYFLPLALGWEEDEEHMHSLGAATVARVRQQANVGVLADAIADEAFCRHVVKAIGERRNLPTQKGMLRFSPTAAFSELAGEEVITLTSSGIQAQSTNTSVTL